MGTLENPMEKKRKRAKVLRKRTVIHSLIFLTKLRCAHHFHSGVYFTNF
jgi:hypothetical protein